MQLCTPDDGPDGPKHVGVCVLKHYCSSDEVFAIVGPIVTQIILQDKQISWDVSSWQSVCLFVCSRGILLQGREQYEEAIKSYQLAIQYRPTLACKYSACC